MIGTQAKGRTGADENDGAIGEAAAAARSRARGWHNVVGATPDELRQAELDALVRYGDIIDLPAPTSRRHPRQPPEVRAAQFSPFAALTGYEEQVREAQRHVEARREMAPDQRESVSRALNEAAALLARGEEPLVSVMWFVPDRAKDGGTYATARGRATKIDEYARTLVLTCEDANEGMRPGTQARIPLDDIWQVAVERDPEG